MFNKNKFLIFSVIIITVLAVFLNGCKKDDDDAPAVATTIEIVDGNDQSATVGTKLTNPVKVIIKDQYGKAFAGEDVTFAIANGSGTLSKAKVTTGVDGKAQVEWTLSETEGTQKLTASITGSSVEFSATGTTVPAVATTIEKLDGGDNQTATVETALPNPVVVIIKDQYGKAFAGTEVTFATTDGSGTVSKDKVTTDTEGKASVTWTLGLTIGIQKLTASATGITGSSVTFSATGTAVPAATTIEIESGDGQIVAIGNDLTNPIVVIVKDQ